MARLTRVAPELPTANLQKALAYFEQKLGFRVAMQMPDRGYAIIERGGVAIHLFQDGTAEHSPVGIHIFTPDLEALYTEFQQSWREFFAGDLAQAVGQPRFSRARRIWKRDQVRRAARRRVSAFAAFETQVVAFCFIPLRACGRGQLWPIASRWGAR